ncbi:MAG: hypothetical protein KGJ02_01250 [Verrucomicrobiota bacterium]|nr:hypothetical protein [Verrucomicrobiota bacterium]
MRVELIHPMLVHFPLALLLTGIGLKIVAFFFKRAHFYYYLQIASWMNLGLGVFFAWMAILAGGLAEDVVRKNLCKVEFLNDHIFFAYTATYLFTFALLLDFGRTWMKRRFSSSFHKVVSIINFLLFLGATSMLLLTGFFGGSLVYDQGAAVEKCCKPSG